MGMSIEDIIQGLKETYMICCSVFAYDRKKYIDGAIDRLNKYQMMQADYENRLKADMAAMLEDLRLDFQEAELAGVLDNKELIFADEVDDLVQQKISLLKEHTIETD